MQKKGNKYGTHRVIEPKGLLTQAAKKIDNTMECYSNEILCDVSALNIDSASFTQIYEACGKDLGKTEQMILDIVGERGKMQNPVTGSGGMFMGTVAKIGDDLKGKIDLKAGDRIVSIGTQLVESTDDVTNALKSYNVGDVVEVQVDRGRELITLQVTLGEKTGA